MTGPTTIERPEGEAPAEERAPVARRRGFRISLWIGLGLLIVVGLGLLAVLPTRAWLHQQRQLEERQTELIARQAENARLEDKLNHLLSDEANDEVAREKLGLVKPDEKALAVLPAPELTLDALPDTWPYPLLRQLASTRG